MTVKSLFQHQKDHIVKSFLDKTMTINGASVLYRRHRRTIIRVLEEQGIDPMLRVRRARVSPPPAVSTHWIKQDDLGLGQLMYTVEHLNTTPQRRQDSLRTSIKEFFKKFRVFGAVQQ